jgi:hypothetical protein
MTASFSPESLEVYSHSTYKQQKPVSSAKGVVKITDKYCDLYLDVGKAKQKQMICYLKQESELSWIGFVRFLGLTKSMGFV